MVELLRLREDPRGVYGIDLLLREGLDQLFITVQILSLRTITSQTPLSPGRLRRTRTCPCLLVLRAKPLQLIVRLCNLHGERVVLNISHVQVVVDLASLKVGVIPVVTVTLHALPARVRVAGGEVRLHGGGP